MKKCSDTEHLPPARGWGWRQPALRTLRVQPWVQLHDHPENSFARGRRPPGLWEAMEPGGKPGGKPCWRRTTQLAAAGRLQAPSCSRRSPQTVLQGFALRRFFHLLNTDGRRVCFSISEPEQAPGTETRCILQTEEAGPGYCWPTRAR